MANSNNNVTVTGEWIFTIRLINALCRLRIFCYSYTIRQHLKKHVIYLFLDDLFLDTDEVVLAECSQLWDDCKKPNSLLILCLVFYSNESTIQYAFLREALLPIS